MNFNQSKSKTKKKKKKGEKKRKRKRKREKKKTNPVPTSLKYSISRIALLEAYNSITLIADSKIFSLEIRTFHFFLKKKKLIINK